MPASDTLSKNPARGIDALPEYSVQYSGTLSSVMKLARYLVRGVDRRGGN
jgi:hypothetical protein